MSESLGSVPVSEASMYSAVFVSTPSRSPSLSESLDSGSVPVSDVLIQVNNMSSPSLSPSPSVSIMLGLVE